ncbi:MAG TPA: hypothetical protein VFF37_04980 [Streptomyces sp.]|nr:hypothetical protein [Streptomyces sp.]
MLFHVVPVDQWTADADRPHGPIERAAVTAVLAVRRDADGHARELTPWA